MQLLVGALVVIAADVVWAMRRMMGRPSRPVVRSQPADGAYRDRIWRDLERDGAGFRMRSDPGPFG